MSNIFSRSCQYALRAVVYLSKREEGSAVHVREISDALDIPHHFLGKILQILNRDGIVFSAKGTNGGFRLGRPASEIRLAEIVDSVDGGSTMGACILGFPECREDDPCPLHGEWKASRAIIVNMLDETTVEELSERLAPVPAVPAKPRPTPKPKPIKKAETS